MKKNSFIILMCLIFLNSCITSKVVWDENRIEKIKYYFLKSEDTKLVLVGTHIVSGTNDKIYLYETNDQNIVKIFKVASQSGIKIKIIESGYIESIDVMKDVGLSENDKKFLKRQGIYTSDKRKDSFIHIYIFDNKSKTNPKFTQTIVTKESIQKQDFSSLSDECQFRVYEKFTTSEKVNRVLITPFSLVADIVSVPFVVIASIIAAIGMGPGSHG